MHVTLYLNAPILFLFFFSLLLLLEIRTIQPDLVGR